MKNENKDYVYENIEKEMNLIDFVMDDLAGDYPTEEEQEYDNQYCGRYIFRTKKFEFNYRMKEKLK